jgi:UDP-N-acetylglucosamine 2-epimerase (non-hydrolysing)
MNKNKKEVFILGTRPTVIKLAPLIKKMNPFVIQTGQHTNLADDMYKVFDIEPDLRLKIENKSLTGFISNCMKELDIIFTNMKIDRVWVHGDTSSCLAGALVAAMHGIPLVHNEAGLRTWNKYSPFPEEMNRKIIDSVADILFAPTQKNVRNLKMENVKGRIYCVGNTVVDALGMIKPQLPAERPIEEKYVLMTMHRRESFEKDIYTTLKVIKKLSKNIKVIFPAHPNPNVQKAVKKTKIKTIEPLNYLDFLWYLRDCEYVISDSGGLQEECPSFNKPLLILRKNTERQEILKTGMAFLSDLTEKDLNLKIKKVQKLVGKRYRKNPFGNGNTSDKIIKIINEN